MPAIKSKKRIILLLSEDSIKEMREYSNEEIQPSPHKQPK